MKPSELQTVKDSVSSWSSSKTSLGSSISPHSAASVGPGPPIKGPSGPPPSGSIGPMPLAKGPPRIIGPSMGPVSGVMDDVLNIWFLILYIFLLFF